MHRLARLSLLLILSVLPAFAAPRPPLPEKVSNGDAPPDYPAEAARRAEAAKVLLGQGDLDGASQELDKAFAADPTQPMAYFYRSVVFYRRGDYGEALRYATLGRDELQEIIKNEGKYDGDDEQLLRFKELADAIQAKQESVKALGPQVDPAKKKQEFDDSLRAGDEAYGKGLLAKAAAAYAKAFRADPTQGEIGLRAATLYGDRLKNLSEAALLWQQVLAAGEPHATTARAELQSHREALDALLQDGLARREQWRNSQDASEPLRLAQAFPESAELQIELALLFARKGQTDDMINHLQSASRLGLSAEDFLARAEFTDYFARAGGLDAAASQPLVSFVRDAYGDETLAAIRTELKRRADETVRLAREKAEKERQARLAAERKELLAWRNARQSDLVRTVHSYLSANNGTEVEVVNTRPLSKAAAKNRTIVIRSTSFSYDSNARAYVLRAAKIVRTILGNGAEYESSQARTYTIPSFASYREASTYFTDWVSYDANSTIRPVDPYGPLCRLLGLAFNAGVIREQSVRRAATGDVINDPDFTNLSFFNFHVMLKDDEMAALLPLFTALAKLDDAGDSVEKLRQLRK